MGIGAKQALNMMGVLGNNMNPDLLDSEAVQKLIDDPKGSGERFTAFLRNGCRFIIGEVKKVATKVFSPTEFLGKGWTVDEQDEHSLELSEVDFSEAKFEHCLKKGESSIIGEEKLKRLKEGRQIRLGATVFLGLLTDYQLNKENSVLEWIRRTYKITYLDFFGTVLRVPDGGRCVLCLDFGGGGWGWRCYWLDSDWGDDSLSAVSPASTQDSAPQELKTSET